jgi:hydrogenase/urease accessory protein HupE
MKRAVLIAFVALLVTGAKPVLHAHESQPGTVELRQVDRDRYEILWRAPIYFGRPHPARLELPEHWRNVVEPSTRTLSDSQLFRRVVSVGNRGVEGTILRFPGLENTITDVFVRLSRVDGSTMTSVVRPSKPYAQLRGERTWYATAAEYVVLGFHHILQGADHLLFVLGLLMIVGGTRGEGRGAKGKGSHSSPVARHWPLLKTVTAFTVAHSITLAIATLGYASVPLPPLNAAIALSILFLGPEIVRTWRGESSLTIRYPWVVAFLFGLLHGFGFASGLSTTGMPKAELPPALFFFNVGVEMGQLVFVFTALALVRSFAVLEVRWPRWAEVLPGYAVGSLGAYWTIQRTLILLGAVR